MIRQIVLAAILTSPAGAAFSASHPVPPADPKPIEVKIISVPPAQPTEVKIVSAPAAVPAEVKITSTPPDESARAMARYTLYIVIANIGLCMLTFAFGVTQRGDNKKSIAVSERAAEAASTSAAAAERSANVANEFMAVSRRQERAAGERELNRAAHRVRATATRLEQLASAVIPARTSLHILIGQGGLPPQLKEESERTLADRRARVQEMSAVALDIIVDDITSISDSLLTSKTWRLDEYQVQLEVMRESITEELTRYENESLTRRQQATAMRAAALNAQMQPQPPKTTLG